MAFYFDFCFYLFIPLKNSLLAVIIIIFSSFLRWKLLEKKKPLIFTILYNIYILSFTFSLIITLGTPHILYVIFINHLKYFLISVVICLLTHSYLDICSLICRHCVFSAFLLSYLILFWSENTFCKTNLRLALWPSIRSILVNVP